MADPNTEVVEQNVENVEACNTECSADSTIDRKSDWMYKRAKLLHNWDSTYFSLLNNTLYYGPSEKLSKVRLKGLSQQQYSYTCIRSTCLRLYVFCIVVICVYH